MSKNEVSKRKKTLAKLNDDPIANKGRIWRVKDKMQVNSAQNLGKKGSDQ
jgi:hypothetical protein